jgi:hypothetical protein
MGIVPRLFTAARGEERRVRFMFCSRVGARKVLLCLSARRHLSLTALVDWEAAGVCSTGDLGHFSGWELF